MRLTCVLLRRNYLPNGSIHRGKDRLVKRVTPWLMRQKKEDFAIEEQNMLYLRHPYLTEEQSFGHTQAMGKPKTIDKIMDKSRKIFKEDVTLYERLLHLRVNEGWDK